MRIVIVGGGAGGLELATKLGRTFGRKKKAEILLIDRNQMHLWKPLLHEVATGTLDYEVDSVSYRAHAYNNGFQFKIGSLIGINREQKHITLQPVIDNEGEQILPQREIHYDKLVIAIGSVSNDFGTPGIAQFCTYLDSAEQAVKFQKRLINRFIRVNQRRDSDKTQNLRVAIVGGGATGVELSAELYNAQHWFYLYGLKNVSHENLKVTLIEAAPRLVAGLSERISTSVYNELTKLGVDIMTGTRVARAEKGQLITSEGNIIKADLMVWAAGVKAPDFLNDFGGLQTNKLNQLLVNEYLQAQDDKDIFALGDCAGCQLGENTWVPPRAQSAHQMASCIYANFVRSIKGKPLKAFAYHDHGSLVSLSRYSTVGSLMGNFTRSSWNVEGKLARMAYISLYRMHQAALHGWIKTLFIALIEKVNHVLRPRLKLH